MILIKAVHIHDVAVQTGAVGGLLAPLLSFIFVPTSCCGCPKQTVKRGFCTDAWEHWAWMDSLNRAELVFGYLHPRKCNLPMALRTLVLKRWLQAWMFPDQCRNYFISLQNAPQWHVGAAARGSSGGKGSPWRRCKLRTAYRVKVKQRNVSGTLMWVPREWRTSCR